MREFDTNAFSAKLTAIRGIDTTVVPGFSHFDFVARFKTFKHFEYQDGR